jgi:hypothetical protein
VSLIDPRHRTCLDAVTWRQTHCFAERSLWWHLGSAASRCDFTCCVASSSLLPISAASMASRLLARDLLGEASPNVIGQACLEGARAADIGVIRGELRHRSPSRWRGLSPNSLAEAPACWWEAPQVAASVFSPPGRRLIATTGGRFSLAKACLQSFLCSTGGIEVRIGTQARCWLTLRSDFPRRQRAPNITNQTSSAYPVARGRGGPRTRLPSGQATGPRRSEAKQSAT